MLLEAPRIAFTAKSNYDNSVTIQSIYRIAQNYICPLMETCCRLALYRYLIVFLVQLVSLNQLSAAEIAANETATVRLLFSNDSKPFADAVVRVTPVTGATKNTKLIVGISDASGIFSFPFTEPSVVAISYLGYTSISDTMWAAEERTYKMVAISQDMKDVVITGQYAVGSVQKSVYEIKVINAETIRAKGANNLREALQNELNIDLGQDAVFGSNMSINGISGEGIKIMVDGVPIVGRLDGKLDLSQINISNIERIEVVEGPMSVMYGTDAMGGVINIITKTFQQEKVNLNLKGYYETVGQYNVELNSGFSFGKSQVYLSGGRYFFDGYSQNKSYTRFQEWKPKEQYFADAKYVYNANKFRISLLGSFFREKMIDRSEPKKTINFGDTINPWVYIGSDLNYLTYRPRASLSFMYKFNEGNQLDALISYSGFIRFTSRSVKNLSTLVEQVATDTLGSDTSFYHQIIFRPTYTFPVWKNRLQFQFGGEVNQEYAIQDRIKNGKQTSGDYAAYGSIRLTAIEGFDIQPAVRIIYNTRFQAPLIPSLNLKYNYKSMVVARASYGRGYRAPSLKELFLEFVDINHRLFGNEQLKPENGHNVNASISYSPSFKSHGLTFEASGFYNYILNKIDWKLLGAVGPELNSYQYFNIKKYITYGGDFGVTYRWKKLQINTSAIITNYAFNLSGSSVMQKTWSPDFTANASYLIPKAEIGVTVYYKYNGVKPLFSVNNSIQTGSRAAYHMLDVSLVRSFWKNRIQLQVGGKNLIGVSNVAADNVTGVGHNFSSSNVNIGWGRTFFTSLILHFSK